MLAVTLWQLSLPENGWVVQYNAYQGWSALHWFVPVIRVGHLSEDGIKDTITFTRERNRSLKVVGGSSTFNDLTFSHDVDVALDFYLFNQLLTVDRSHANETGETLVTFEGGAKLHEVTSQLAAINLALDFVPGFDGISFVGGVMTGSHGMGATMASSVVGLRSVVRVLFEQS